MRRLPIVIVSIVMSLLGGCSQDNPSLFIASALQLDTMCGFSPSSSTLTSGTWDFTPQEVAGASAHTTNIEYGYTLPLLLQSGVFSRNEGTRSALRPDTATIIVEGAVVTLYQGAPGASDFAQIDSSSWDEGLSSSYTVPATGSVAPSLTGQPGLGSLAVGLIPAAIATQLYNNYFKVLAGNNSTSFIPLVAGIRVYGKTLGGFSVETAEWFWPMNLCEKCLMGIVGCSSAAACAAYAPCAAGENGEVYPGTIDPAHPTQLKPNLFSCPANAAACPH